MTTYVIYHDPCTDGMTALWITKKAIPDAVPIPGKYNIPAQQYLDDYNIQPDDSVYLVDFSLKRDALKYLASHVKQVIVIDHHKSAQKELENIEDEADNITCVFDMNYSGAGLCSKYFFPKHEPPTIVKSVQDRDLWKFDLYGTKEIHAYLNKTQLSLKRIEETHNQLETDLHQVIGDGRILVENHTYLANQFAEQPPSSIRITSYSEIVPDIPGSIKTGKYSCIVKMRNVPGIFASETGNIIAERNDNGISFTFHIEDGHLNASMRANADCTTDVSEIAAAFGGGGHAKAAGFRLKPSLFHIL